MPHGLHKIRSRPILNISIWGEMDHPAWDEMELSFQDDHLAHHIYSC